MGLTNFAKVLAVLVMATAILVMAGWFLNIPILKSILPHWVTMKFNTALCFFLSGIILYFCADSLLEGQSIAYLVLPLPCLLIAMIMACLLVSVVLGVNTGIENLFVQEEVGAIESTAPGRPSLGTMICFIIIDMAGLIAMMKSRGLTFWYQLLGASVAMLGILAVVGYGIKVPQLYYSVEGISSAMAFHTAILFILLGIGFFMLGNLVVGGERS